MAELAIQYITNANLEWARTDLGPLDELAKSIKEHGVQKPVLIQEDFLMIDGARRVAAAQQIGLDVVPVQFIRNWEDVLEYLDPTGPDCLPMNWLDLHNYWGNVLKPIHSKHHRVIAARTRRANAKDAQSTNTTSTYSGYIIDLAHIYHAEPGTIKLFRDYMIRLAQMKKSHPDLVAGMYKAFPNGDAARDLVRSRFIKSLVERVKKGELEQSEALMLFTVRLRSTEPGTLLSYRRVRPSANRILDKQAPAISIEQLENLVELLGHVAMNARTFLNFDSSVSQRSQELIKQISDSVTDINNMRRRLGRISDRMKKDSTT